MQTGKPLILDGHLIKRDIQSILSLLKSKLSNGKLSDIDFRGNEVRVTCPFHKDGRESNPSCYIYAGDDGSLTWGTFHCFTCNKKGSLVSFVSGCLECSFDEAKEWLKDNFTEKIVSQDEALFGDDISLERNPSEQRQKKIEYLPDSVLDAFQTWHPYIEQRHISKEVASRFELRYDPKTETIVFPVRDKSGSIAFLTRRSVKEKRFYIDKSASKTIYLLNEALKDRDNEVIVVESQINALVAYSYGFPAIALFGAGTTEGQMSELNKSGILHFILMYDNDSAGRHGAYRFKEMINKDRFITDIEMPLGKDVADCTYEEFWKILKENGIEKN